MKNEFCITCICAMGRVMETGFSVRSCRGDTDMSGYRCVRTTKQENLAIFNI